MSWASAVKERPAAKTPEFTPIDFETEPVDWSRLVTLDWETYYDQDYTLSKLSTSEYIRDKRFKAQMLGITIGNKPVKIVTGARIAAELRKIPWETHSLLCHHTQFDAFILSHHYKIFPKKLYCTLSMARGLHSNEIGGGLDEVSKFYGGQGKIEGGLEPTRGVLKWSPALIKTTGVYCANDTAECRRIFKEMIPKYPRDEIDLIDLTCRMFTDPVLKVNIPRVEAELAREIKERDELMLAILPLIDQSDEALVKSLLKTKAERALTGKERDLLLVKRAVGSNEKFATLLKTQGVTKPPVKISPAWIKNGRPDDGTKWTFAFAKDDQDFIQLPDNDEEWSSDLDRNAKTSAMELAVRASIIRALVDCRLAVKSTTNITRAQRFLTAGANGMPLPCYYAYFRAHTGRWGGGDKRNMQNLTRGGELRQSIEAPKGHQLCVVDSGQIEARTNGWLWGQDDLLEAFQAADAGVGRDAYCLMGDTIYGRTITKADATERFVGKVAVLGLGFQMGAPKLQITLAKGALGGPPVYFTLRQCEDIVNKYRRKNDQIVAGWAMCKKIIEDMADGRTGSWKCLSWGKGYVMLPNGMALKYPDLKKATGEHGWDEWSYQAGEQRKKIYGGLLCENIVQALARIIVGMQMLAISRKYRVVMTTHDECVTCVKTPQAPKAFDFMVSCFRTPLKWCPDLPLNAEGGFAFNYSK
jgi:hypothetical protein